MKTKTRMPLPLDESEGSKAVGPKAKLNNKPVERTAKRVAGRRKPIPTKSFLESRFRYDQNSGVLYWKKRPKEHFESQHSCNVWNARYADKEAGCTHTAAFGHKSKVVRVLIDGKKTLFYAHRLIWWLNGRTFGPFEEIDHRDGDPLNNRMDNLRAVSHMLNMANVRRKVARVCPVTADAMPQGVSYDRGRYVAQMRFNNVRVLGKKYRSIDAAKQAYVKTSTQFRRGMCPVSGKEPTA